MGALGWEVGGEYRQRSSMVCSPMQIQSVCSRLKGGTGDGEDVNGEEREEEVGGEDGAEYEAVGV